MIKTGIYRKGHKNYDSMKVVGRILARFEEEARTGERTFPNIASSFDDLREKALNGSERCYFLKKGFPKLTDNQKRLYLYFASFYESGHTCLVLSDEQEEEIQMIFGMGYRELIKNLKVLGKKKVCVLVGSKEDEMSIGNDCSLLTNIKVTFSNTEDGKTINYFAMMIDEPLLVMMMHNRVPNDVCVPAWIKFGFFVPIESEIESLLEKCVESSEAEEGDDECPTSTEPE